MLTATALEPKNGFICTSLPLSVYVGACAIPTFSSPSASFTADKSHVPEKNAATEPSLRPARPDPESSVIYAGLLTRSMR